MTYVIRFNKVEKIFAEKKKFFEPKQVLRRHPS